MEEVAKLAKPSRTDALELQFKPPPYSPPVILTEDLRAGNVSCNFVEYSIKEQKIYGSTHLKSAIESPPSKREL